MPILDAFDVYNPNSRSIEERDETPRISEFSQPAEIRDPNCYIPDESLQKAVNVAIALGQPLLITGEPGTGKTQLAASVAADLNIPLFAFYAKTTSVAKDLFYRYDSLGHFHDAQFRKEHVITADYLTYEALGLAILCSRGDETTSNLIPQNLRNRCPIRSVVLIDEIDKAPRDLPNDILNELEEMEFIVRETGLKVKADSRYRPLLIITSNSEKNLPDAFLRRCVFHHISFPSREKLLQIVSQKMELADGFTPVMLENALTHFESIRALALKKRPATAELLAWLRVLNSLRLDPLNPQPGTVEALAFTYSILAKSKEDREAMLQLLQPAKHSR